MQHHERVNFYDHLETPSDKKKYIQWLKKQILRDMSIKSIVVLEHFYDNEFEYKHQYAVVISLLVHLCLPV